MFYLMQHQQQQQQQPAQQQKPGGGQLPQREKIWTGILEWIEKTKTGPEQQQQPPQQQQRVSRSVPCYVTANAKDGEPEM